jgi:predicted anti-sigma-YlaC factor YlaD
MVIGRVAHALAGAHGVGERHLRRSILAADPAVGVELGAGKRRARRLLGKAQQVRFSEKIMLQQ